MATIAEITPTSC